MNVQIPWTKLLQIHLELATSLPSNTEADYLWWLSDAWLVCDGQALNMNMQGNPGQPWILDFTRGFRIPGTGFQPLSLELGLWIPIVSGNPQPLSCIPDSITQDSRFHNQNFPWFLNTLQVTCWKDEFSLMLTLSCQAGKEISTFKISFFIHQNVKPKKKKRHIAFNPSVQIRGVARRGGGGPGVPVTPPW